MSAYSTHHQHIEVLPREQRVAFLTCHDKVRLVTEALAPLGF
ncbi:hypothetical protein [Ectopseudomonas guguanensis]|uniref:Uncharacterized protein n=2 Tax=Ectopseudomonas guguanensis TaxID=1198456 RepID=A0A1H0WFM6_9GAMM|nr:hypothetical protein [Pseudomonas guguanensis]SDP89351.1 hypothetical protein SAMN05216213_10726 [Pseudomonas guguanensis]